MKTEKLLTDRDGFALEASALQRALVNAADGLPVALPEDDAQRYFGCSAADLGRVAPVLVVVVAGVRAGKSLLAGCAAVKGVMTADLSKLKRHEVARFAIVAPTTDNASATFHLLVGACLESRTLRRRVVGDPTSDTIALRREDGREVEIVVVAASRGAVTLRSRWLAGFVLDEVALFGSEPSGAVVNAEELLRAAETRLVPGAQGWMISSPFGPQGLLYEMYKAHWGNPGRVLVVHAPTRAMNPAFPVEQVEAIRQRQPDVAAREYDAAWIDAETALYSGLSLTRATRQAPPSLPYEPGVYYVAAIDPATRGNGWTLAVAGQRRDGRRSVVLVHEWRGSRQAPLSPRAVFGEITQLLRPYGLDFLYTDQGAGADALRDHAEAVGLTLCIEPTTQVSKRELYTNLQVLLDADQVELPPHAQVRQDLMGVRKVVTRSGIGIELAKTPDGRHCDFAPSVATAVGKAVVAFEPKTQSTSDFEARRQRFLEEQERRRRPWQFARWRDG